MTGKELIIYILQNDLVDSEIFSNGTLSGFVTENQMAIKFNVGVETIHTMYILGLLKGFELNGTLYFLSNQEPSKHE